MKILIACQFFNYFSGSATYVLDLAYELTKRGHLVTILSNTGGEITEIAEGKGIRCVDFSQNQLLIGEKFDIIHGNQYMPTEFAVTCFPDVPVVQTLHNSLGVEQPYFHKNVKRYIAAKESEVSKFSYVSPQLIHIGVDFEKYRPLDLPKYFHKRTIAFIGTYDYLRDKALHDLIREAEREDFDVVYIGKPMQSFDPAVASQKVVQVVSETADIEIWMNRVDCVASILLGRTAIEAWACNKPYLCYTVDQLGNILKKQLLQPPSNMDIYDIKFMKDEVEKIYQQIVNK